jgi:hypothetical protein
MKMKPGPKAFFYFVMAGVLIGFGYWIGRGFPRTWNAVLHPAAVVSAEPAPSLWADSPRFDLLESRVSALEQEVSLLKDEARSGRRSAPGQGEPPPLTTEPSSGPPNLPPPSTDRTDAGVEYR